MNYRNGAASFGWGSLVVLSAAALLLLPMATRAQEEKPVAASLPETKSSTGGDSKELAESKPATVEASSQFTQFRSNPTNGASNVDPGLTEIVIRFDREMRPGMSITGDPKLLPPIDPARKPAWRNDRTFVLPVKLAEGAYYRIGVNSKSHMNFRPDRGLPVWPSVIAFTTKGASKELEAKVAAPRVVTTEPALGAMGVNPELKEMKVTFDMPMGEGRSFTGAIPGDPDGRPVWSEDRRTITLPLKLEPGREYRFGLNGSRPFSNFQSEWGVPLEPVAVEFSTAAAK